MAVASRKLFIHCQFGDYQFNGAMAISGLLKAQGIKMAPRDIANKVGNRERELTIFVFS